ncbi:MAG: cytochrome c oxidase subunit 3 [Arsenophonus sp.]|nr:MAG: cytochrome c oxidase subunit 3 [Arsenophonus sp.]
MNSIIKRHLLNNEDFYKDKNSITVFGFWIYLMSDLIVFSCLFSIYFVLSDFKSYQMIEKYFFNISVVIETFILLISSVTCSFSIFFLYTKKKKIVNFWLFITFILGLLFFLMEFFHFFQLINLGYTPKLNAFLSSWFILLGTHLLHIFFALIWIIFMFISFKTKGFNQTNRIRLHCLGYFWHFLDIIWILIFNFIFLLGL